MNVFALPDRPHPALYDQVTGLASADLFVAMLGAAGDRAERSGQRGAVIVATIAGAESGYAPADDPTIAAVAARLELVLRRSDYIARVSHDTFCVLISDQASIDTCQVVRKIRNAFHLPLELSTGGIRGVEILAAAARFNGSHDALAAVDHAAAEVGDVTARRLMDAVAV